MVIIKRDDYISFLNSTGVKMPTTPITTNECLTQPTGNANLIFANNNNSSNNNNNNINNATNIATIKRDSSQQQLQQLQAYTQQQQQPQQQIVNQNQTLAAKAQLICRPNSHPFPSRTLLLEPKKAVKIGRAIARTKVSDNNAIFDCKVLSRNHAELWYDDGKFYLKDTGSSNGTFINNQRLSQTCSQSEPFEVSSGDIVQFGVDVMENSRRETHGCIVATLKLYLPDGRETKASQSTLVGGSNTKIPQVDLYRLNQYIQEAVQREQNLESKLLAIQKKIDLVRKSSSASWQALVDEDRLLSRIDMLEKKLLYFSKPLSEDKLREEIMKLQNEKMQYQTSAKQALKKVYNERMEALQKLGIVEKELLSTEDECSLLRDQVSKSQNQSRETNERLDVMQNQMDKKISDYEDKIYKKESELKNLNSELNDLQEKLSNYRRQNDFGDYENSQMLTNWLLKSDIKDVDGSEDIIKAICDDEDDEINLAKSLETNCSRVYIKMLTLEKELNLLFAATNNNIINNNNTTNDTTNESESNVKMINHNDSKETLLDNQQQQENHQQQPDHVPSSMPIKDEKDVILLASIENQQSAQHNKQQCDDNQNNMNMNNNNNQMIMMQNFNVTASSERILVNLKQLFALYAKLKRQLMEFSDVKENEQSSYKEKCDEMSSQLLSLKLELESRPTQDDYDEKMKQCNDLRTELSTLTDQLANNTKLLEQLRGEMNDECVKYSERSEKSFSECSSQTEDEEEDVSVIEVESTNKRIEIDEVPEIPILSVESQFNVSTSTSSTEITKNIFKKSKKDDVEADDDDLNNHPKVLYEDELIVFKEKCKNLSEENIRLQRELSELRTTVGYFHGNWLHNAALKYIVPIIIVFIGYIYLSLKS